MLLRILEEAVFQKEGNGDKLYGEEVHSRLRLTLGAVCQKLTKQGQGERARRIIVRFHDQLGMHG